MPDVTCVKSWPLIAINPEEGGYGVLLFVEVLVSFRMYGAADILVVFCCAAALPTQHSAQVRIAKNLIITTIW